MQICLTKKLQNELGIAVEGGFEEKDEVFADCKIILDYDVSLRDYIGEPYKIIYRYDFGDNWVHEIKKQRVFSGHDKNYPVCIMGQGNTPPEDVGGVPGYEEFLQIISDPKHEEYESILAWARSQLHRDFDIDYVNRSLRNVLKR